MKREFPALRTALADCDFIVVCREMTALLLAWLEPTGPTALQFVIAKTMVPVPPWMACAFAKKVNKIQL